MMPGVTVHRRLSNGLSSTCKEERLQEERLQAGTSFRWACSPRDLLLWRGGTA